VRVVARWPAMSTLVTVTAVGRSEARIAAALDGAFAEMDRLIGIFDRRRADTALAVLNADGRLDGPPPELADVARRAAHLHRLTGGAFDPTVAPLVDLVLRAARAPVPRAPDVAELADARALTGMADVELSGRRIRLGRAGQALTLDGIAKGAIVDAVAAVLERGGVRDYCIEAGGDIRTGGTREPGRPWTIAVRDPDGPGTLPGRLSLSGGAVATSGPYERGPHVVDPAAGRAADGLRSVSVAAPSAALADALATAVVVLRPAAGRALIERLPGCACLLIRSDGTRIASARWKESA
jgi:thiamine biosynthesis lipoprotein